MDAVVIACKVEGVDAGLGKGDIFESEVGVVKGPLARLKRMRSWAAGIPR